MVAGYRKGVPVLDGMDLYIDQPGLYRVMGRNGSGKSTLLELLSGFLKPWSGDVHLCGVNASSPKARDLRNICRTIPALYPSMTVHDHIAFASRTRGLEFQVNSRRLIDYGLDQWEEQPVTALSTGNIRKLWLLMCTVANTPAVVMDEPFNGLDTQGITALIDELTTWRTEKIVILITHLVPEQLQFDQNIVFQEKAKVR